ncbi:hypothetical protein J6590_006369 [Homalodisca vitripennis]|nr:hypothetical protein J6590_093253 [Homalodisca vitripennis]KAG8323359.1 hypothetical protein J6590_006369 [Homalodisca vitripennis]
MDQDLFYHLESYNNRVGTYKSRPQEWNRHLNILQQLHTIHLSDLQPLLHEHTRRLKRYPSVLYISIIQRVKETKIADFQSATTGKKILPTIGYHKSVGFKVFVNLAYLHQPNDKWWPFLLGFEAKSNDRTRYLWRTSSLTTR